MIDLNEVRRVRLHGGTRIHAVDPTSKPSVTTRCGKPVKLTGPIGRVWDWAYPPQQAVTCPLCVSATPTKEN